MIEFQHALSGFAVKDVEEAKRFYGEVLALPVSVNQMGILTIVLPGGAEVMAYPKDDHEPAGFTILNFVVDDIDEAVDELVGAGLTMERYEGMPQDDRGVMRGKEVDRGPNIAWFLDPSGNVLSLLET